MSQGKCRKKNMRTGKLAILFLCLALISCEHRPGLLGTQKIRFQVSYNPYEEVIWQEWRRCLSQHHDHINARVDRIRAYDRAGYQAVVMLGYGGNPKLPFAYRQRLWPVGQVVEGFKNDDELLATLDNIRFFIPAMEETGREHTTSPFLTQYIEKYPENSGKQKAQNQYQTPAEAMALITKLGGIPVLAHPTRTYRNYANLPLNIHVEIYNAQFRYRFFKGDRPQDDNEHFLKIWDALLLERSTRTWGYAVNDWHGPFNLELHSENPEIYDSGKTLVMVKEFSIEAYRRSIERGAFFAIRDLGVEKNRYPRIDSIAVTGTAIEIFSQAGAEVRWIGNGALIASDSRLLLQSLPENLRYARAEVSNEHGTVFVQPFTLRPAVPR